MEDHCGFDTLCPIIVITSCVALNAPETKNIEQPKLRRVLSFNVTPEKRCRYDKK